MRQMKKNITYKIIILAALLLFVFLKPGMSQKSKSYVIGFYNVENLFDTFHDIGKGDFEYLPDGANEWTAAKYNKKLHNMATVIRDMKEDNKAWHAVLGLSEVENRHVLEDLVSQPEIADANYQIVHFEGPDYRGVDVALLYDPTKFQLLEEDAIPYNFDSKRITFTDTVGMKRFLTRDILMARGMLGGEMFAFYVAHLPSRAKTDERRCRGAEIIHDHAVELMKEFPGIKIVVMGDMNDNPTDRSMTKFLHGREKIDELKDDDFFNPFIAMYKNGYGSLAYRVAWNIFDIIMVNKSLAQAKEGTLKIVPIVKKKYYGRVFHKPDMEVQEGQYKGTPFRTFQGGAFIGGYSDHFPTYIVVTNK